ncbi:MAG: hypothetical protein H0T75_13700, partial [Rhizobiales bacterium]|nr:hypothetical protein [Hyphomicrobiales bacterium]
MNEHLVLCGGTKRAGRAKHLQLALSGKDQNITLKLEDISRRLVRNLPDRLVDLLEIATYVFCADRAISRGGEAQTGNGAAWRRRLHFVVPVRDPDHWRRPEILEALQTTLTFLSDDEYGFEFETAEVENSVQSYLEFTEDESSISPDEIVLFSGGLDSVAGAVEELSRDMSIALVSHRSSPKTYSHQKALVADLQRRFPGKVMHFPVLITRLEGLRAPETTQRTRSFLYSTLACVIA